MQMKEMICYKYYVETISKKEIIVKYLDSFPEYFSYQDILGDSPVKMICLDRDCEIDDSSEFKGMLQSEVFEKFGITTYGVMPDGGAILPLYRLSHSGDAFSTTDFRDRWDSWMCGFAYISAEDAKEYGLDGNTCLEWIKYRVQEYDDYVNGWVYELKEISITPDSDTGSIENDIIESYFIIGHKQMEEDIPLVDDTPYDSIFDVVDKFGDKAGLVMINHTVKDEDEIEEILTTNQNKSFRDGFRACAEMFGLDISAIIDEKEVN